MKISHRSFTVFVAIVILLSLPGLAVAGTQTWTNGDLTITFSTPNTYYLCPTEPATDAITVTGLPAGWRLIGWVETQYIVPTGRQSIQMYNVNFTSDGINPFGLIVHYPSINEWPATLDPDTGLREMHIDISISAYDQFGDLAGWLGGDLINAPGTLGPGNDWDVFCFYTPPPPPPAEGVGTPGYWKNHPEAWLVNSIMIGGQSFTKDQALQILGLPDGDKTITLFRSLVATKLNVLVGNESSCIAETINSADAWLATYPVLSGVEGQSAAWKSGEPLYEMLDMYNNGELCAPARD